MKNEPSDEKERRDEKQTPIIDGDARPDETIEPDAASLKKSRRQKTDEGEVTSNRAADVNKLEDYKDAK